METNNNLYGRVERLELEARAIFDSVEKLPGLGFAPSAIQAMKKHVKETKRQLRFLENALEWE